MPCPKGYRPVKGKEGCYDKQGNKFKGRTQAQREKISTTPSTQPKKPAGTPQGASGKPSAGKGGVSGRIAQSGKDINSFFQEYGKRKFSFGELKGTQAGLILNLFHKIYGGTFSKLYSNLKQIPDDRKRKVMMAGYDRAFEFYDEQMPTDAEVNKDTIKEVYSKTHKQAANLLNEINTTYEQTGKRDPSKVAEFNAYKDILKDITTQWKKIRTEYESDETVSDTSGETTTGTKKPPKKEPKKPRNVQFAPSAAEARQRTRPRQE